MNAIQSKTNSFEFAQTVMALESENSNFRSVGPVFDSRSVHYFFKK